MKIILALIVIAVLFAFGGYVLPLTARMVILSGALTPSEAHFAGSCQKIGGVVGGEDITIDPVSGLAFISAYDRRAFGRGESARGAIYALDLSLADGATPIVRMVSGEEPADFQPHGISLLKEDGKIYIFAINHRREGGHTIEVFEAAPDGELTFLETLRDAEAFTSPNDLAAVGRQQFYFSNDRGTSGGMEVLPVGNLVYYDSGETEIMDSNIGFANGVQVSRDGREVYLGAAVGRRVHIYTRAPATGALTKRQVFVLPAGVDNIELDETGALWIGAHPQMFTFLEHAASADVLSPSQVFRLDPVTGAYEEIYYNDGEELSGSATAAVWGEFLLIGPVFDPHILLCRSARNRT